MWRLMHYLLALSLFLQLQTSMATASEPDGALCTEIRAILIEYAELTDFPEEEIDRIVDTCIENYV